jgi:hypothetical protein
MLSQVGSLTSVPDELRRAALSKVALDYVAHKQPDVARVLSQLERKKRKSVDELLMARKVQEQLTRTADEMTDVLAAMLADAGGGELDLATRSGLVTVDAIGIDKGFDTAEVVQRYVELLVASVGPDSRTLPMLDDASGDMLRAWEREKGLPARPAHQAEEGALAGYMIERVEAFPDASMAEIIDARTALGKPLVGFRSAVGTMAAALSTAPWDASFEPEARSLYAREVAPAIQELEALALQTGVRHALARHVAGSATVTVAGLGLVVTTVDALPQLALLAGAASVAATAAKVASGIYAQRQDLAAKRSANKMLFLYEAERELVDRRGRRTEQATD